MATDADEATTALIAKMLAEDAGGGYGAYGGGGLYDDGGDDSDDSDYGAPKRKPAAKGKKKADAAAPKPAKPAKEPRAPKEPKPAADGDRKRAPARHWTEAETAAFDAALADVGRDWRGIAARVGTRDARAVMSYAQKYFVKMANAGKRLPPAAAASGEGYTLSGKPLDPASGTAKAYGLKLDVVRGHLARGVELPGLLPLPDAEGGAAAPAATATDGGSGSDTGAKENSGAASNGGGASGKKAATPAAAAPAAKRAKRSPASEPKPAAKPAAAKSPASEPPPARPDGEAAVPPPPPRQPSPPPLPPPDRTEYAKARPKRAIAPRAALGATSESLDLLPCREFAPGPPGSGAPGVQPFAVSCSPAALAVMDMHAHMHREEVIGLLGGEWDAAKRAIAVVAAFPCRRAPGSISRTSVELDPASEVGARAAMEAAGLVPVGWYHSHPIFAPTPSQKDAENQRNYQALFRDAAAAAEPFVGAIVGPYDQALPTPGSVTSWFVVAARGGESAVPHALRVDRAGGAAARAPPTADLKTALLAVADAARGEPDTFDLRGSWRRFSAVVDGAPSGPALTRAAKLALSLSRWVEPGEAGDKLVADVVAAAEAAGAK